MIAIHYGLGKHTEDVLPAHRPLASKYSFIAALIYIALSYLVKIIVSLFLLRICSGDLALSRDTKCDQAY